MYGMQNIPAFIQDNLIRRKKHTMKKIIALLMVLAMVLALVACGAKKEEQKPEEQKPEEGTEPVAELNLNVALVTDVGNIDDKSFNQGAWEGVVAFGQANGMKQGEGYNYYRPSEDSTEARVETINTAIKNGANVIVCPGYLFEDAIFNVQDANPEVMFLLLDGEPHDADYNYKTAENTHNILYQEEQAGFLAGYAAVKDGYKKLGFLGGMAVPAVVRYGYGFVQGANFAAEEMGIADQVSIKYWYAGGFAPTDDIKIKMAGWFTDGTEVVFSCGGGIYLSAVAAATEANGKVIGVDVDQSAEGECIITSAMKGLTNSVVIALNNLKGNNGKWTADYAGKTAVLGAADDCVGLPTAEGSWRLNTFTVDEYNALFEKVKNGSIAISNDTENAPAVTIAVDYNA
jgi:basic membrane protein A